MIENRNQKQLARWGGALLDRTVDGGPRSRLAYWCVVHARIEALRDRFPGRILRLSFDQLLDDPEQVLADFCSFVGAPGEQARLYDLIGGNIDQGGRRSIAS